MLKKLHNYLINDLGVAKDSSLLLAVSGGIDSTVMVDLFSRLRYPFAIAHCNFQLRGTESDEDEVFTKGLAEKYGKQFLSIRFDTLEYAKTNKVSVQMAARDLRYNWFQQLIDEYKFDYVATAHHLDDEIETFFINILRGCGIAGLKGIPEKNGTLIRPLLWAGKNVIKSYSKQHQLSFREDSSNLGDYYLRNRIRNSLVPIFKELHPDFGKLMKDNMRRLSEEDAIIAYITCQTREKAVKVKDGQTIIDMGNIPDNRLFMPVLARFLYEFGFNESQIRSINESGKQSGRILESHSHELLVNRGKYIVREKKVQYQGEIIILDKEKIDNQRYADEHDSTYPFKWIISEKGDVQMSSDSAFAYLDYDKLSFPLVFRKWEKGDYFYPLGCKGKKLLSDYFTDIKLSRFEKEECLILFSGEKIAWIAGKRIDERFKTGKNTRRVLIFEWIFNP